MHSLTQPISLLFRFLFLFLFLSSLVNAATPQNPLTSHAPSAPAIIPLLGFGTWQLDVSAANTSAAVSRALQTGYRHIDCAAAYGNQAAVGRGIALGLQKTRLGRSDIWVTSKLWNADHGGRERVERALDRTLRELGVGYLDLWLMHWPVGKTGKGGRLVEDYVETWHSMEAMLSTSKVRHIGVSNFSPKQLKRLIASSKTKPAVHQFELHPYLQQRDWLAWHRRAGIEVTAYSPLGNANPIYRDTTTTTTKDSSSSANKNKPGTTNSGIIPPYLLQETAAKNAPPPLLFDNPELKRIAARRHCTVAQVALAWGMGRGTSVIPKSSHAERIAENWKARECELEEEDLEAIEKVGERYLARFNNPSEGWGVRLFEGLDDSGGGGGES